LRALTPPARRGLRDAPPVIRAPDEPGRSKGLGHPGFSELTQAPGFVESRKTIGDFTVCANCRVLRTVEAPRGIIRTFRFPGFCAIETEIDRT